jgi:hypothetical protein
MRGLSRADLAALRSPIRVWIGILGRAPCAGTPWATLAGVARPQGFVTLKMLELPFSSSGVCEGPSSPVGIACDQGDQHPHMRRGDGLASLPAAQVGEGEPAQPGEPHLAHPEAAAGSADI